MKPRVVAMHGEQDDLIVRTRKQMVKYSEDDNIGEKKGGGGGSYMAMLIQGIVGELKLGER